MPKLVRLNERYWPTGGYGHWCPGCDGGHEINIKPLPNGAKWTFDGNAQTPTFSPSVNMRWGKYADPKFESGHDLSGVCHYTITAGKIKFHDDTTHALKGQTVDLPDLPKYAYVSCERL